jgi:hypothetical protein
MMWMRTLLPPLAGIGLAGCVAYPAPVAYAPPPGPYHAPPPRVYVAPPPRAYVAPPPRRQWVPRRCDRWGRCWGGYWR